MRFSRICSLFVLILAVALLGVLTVLDAASSPERAAPVDIGLALASWAFDAHAGSASAVVVLTVRPVHVDAAYENWIEMTRDAMHGRVYVQPASHPLRL